MCGVRYDFPRSSNIESWQIEKKKKFKLFSNDLQVRNRPPTATTGGHLSPITLKHFDVAHSRTQDAVAGLARQ